MNHKMIELYAVLNAYLTAPRDEQGQGTLEYVGIAAVAALLVGAVVDAINGGQITSAISAKINEIISAGS